MDDPSAWTDKLPEYIKAQELYDTWCLRYGTRDTIIVAFYHQWLYGRTFPVVASMLLLMSKSFNTARSPKNSNYLSAEMWGDQYPHSNTKDIDFDDPHTLIGWMEKYMSNLFDYELGQYTRSGVEHYSLLNEEHEPNDIMRYDEDFTIGDNNDGVLIIDMTQSQYCFIKINAYGDDNINFQYLKPVNTLSYIKSYYPECVEDTQDLEGEELEKEKKNFVNNKKINAKFAKRLKPYTVLTSEDLITMFPKLKKDLTKASKSSKKELQTV